MTSAEHNLQEALFFRLSGEGAALRAAAAAAREGAFANLARPRCVVIVVGDRRAQLAAEVACQLAADARCPIAVTRALPNYVGALDLVIVADEDPGSYLALALDEAQRRGACTVLVDPGEGPLRAAAGRDTVVVSRPAMAPGGSFNGYLGVIASVLTEVGVSNLAPAGIVEEIAAAVDEDIAACAPHRDLTVNPARQAAHWLVGRRLAVATLRGASEPLAQLGALHFREAGRLAHAAAVEDLAESMPLLLQDADSPARDIFYDPYIDGGDTHSADPLGALILATAEQAALLYDRFDGATWARVEAPALDATSAHPLVDVCVTSSRVAAIAAFLASA